MEQEPVATAVLGASPVAECRKANWFTKALPKLRTLAGSWRLAAAFSLLLALSAGCGSAAAQGFTGFSLALGAGPEGAAAVAITEFPVVRRQQPSAKHHNRFGRGAVVVDPGWMVRAGI